MSGDLKINRFLEMLDFAVCMEHDTCYLYVGDNYRGMLEVKGDLSRCSFYPSDLIDGGPSQSFDGEIAVLQTIKKFINMEEI